MTFLAILAVFTTFLDTFLSSLFYHCFLCFSPFRECQVSPCLFGKSTKYIRIIEKTAKITFLAVFSKNVTDKPDTSESGHFREFQ